MTHLSGSHPFLLIYQVQTVLECFGGSEESQVIQIVIDIYMNGESSSLLKGLNTSKPLLAYKS